MKDLYDVWVLSRRLEFKDDKLPRALAATFARRKTEIPSELPDALTAAFAQAKGQQWNSFVADVAFAPARCQMLSKIWSRSSCRAPLRHADSDPHPGSAVSTHVHAASVEMMSYTKIHRP